MSMFTGLLAMRGGFDFFKGRGMVDYLREIVEELPDAVEIHGDGLSVPKHFHDRRGELLEELNKALEHIEMAEQICTEVSKRL